jgi:succinate dehydrogenase/fumarate reductase flavoprotein subunit
VSHDSGSRAAYSLASSQSQSYLWLKVYRQAPWGWPQSQSQLCYYRRSVRQSVLVSSPHLGPKKNFCHCHAVSGSLIWGVFSDERTCLSFTIADGPRQCSHYWVRVLRDSWAYFTVSDSTIPQTGGPGPRIYTPQE